MIGENDEFRYFSSNPGMIGYAIGKGFCLLYFVYTVITIFNHELDTKSVYSSGNDFTVYNNYNMS